MFMPVIIILLVFLFVAVAFSFLLRKGKTALLSGCVTHGSTYAPIPSVEMAPFSLVRQQQQWYDGIFAYQEINL